MKFPADIIINLAECRVTNKWPFLLINGPFNSRFCIKHLLQVLLMLINKIAIRFKQSLVDTHMPGQPSSQGTGFTPLKKIINCVV